MNKIRFAVIGTGNISRWFLDAAKEVEEFSFTALYSRSKEKGEDFLKDYNNVKLFTDLNEMLKWDEIDAVYIATPNALHYQQTMLALQYKKPVLCEKAFASNSKETKEMIKMSKELNVPLMEAMRITVLPNFQAIKDNLHKIGKIRKYTASYCQYSSRYDNYKNGIIENAFKNQYSNGALMDIGVYCIHPMVNLFGRPNSLKATSKLLKSNVDGQGTVVFEYEDMEAVINYSKISNSYMPSEIQGENGSIIINKITSIDEAKIIYRDGREEVISSKQYPKDMIYEIKEFINLIMSNKIESDKNNHKNTIVVMELMDEVRKQIGLKYPADHK